MGRLTGMRRAAATATFLLGSAPSWAFGGPAAAREDAENERIRQAKECFLHQDYECARAALAEAYERSPQAATLLKLGLAELQADHPLEAAAHLREYLRHDEEPADKLDAVRAKWLPRAEARTARLDVVAPTGAEVLLDGVVQGRAPMASIVIRDGAHEVTARQGTVVEAQHVVARGGELVELHFQRVADSPPPALPSPASLTDAGRVSVAARPQTAKWVTVIGLGTGAVVAAGLGVGFGLASHANATDAQAIRRQLDPKGTGFDCQLATPSCSELNRDISAENRYGTLSTGAYIAAGVLGVASVATWTLWRPGRGSNRAMVVRPTLSARTAGVTVGADW